MPTTQPINQAFEAFQAKDYARALKLFDQTYKETKSLSILFNIGLCYYGLSQLEKAKKAEDARVLKFYNEIMVRLPLEHISGKAEILKGNGVMYIVLSDKLNRYLRILEISQQDVAQLKADIAAKL